MLEPMVLIRAVHYAATLLTSGGLVFWAFVVPADRSAMVAARHRLATRVGAGIALVSAVLWLGAQAAALPAQQGAAATGLAARIIDTLAGTGFGRVWMVRLALLTALLLVTLLRPTRARLGVAALLGLAAAATLAFAGHAAAADPLSRAADMLHLVLAALWLGSLLPLADLLRAAGRNGAARSLSDARAATRRFSSLGVASVGGLLATGIVSAWTLVGTIPGLVGTPYGRLLTLKILLFLAMVGIAGVNRQVLTPALAHPGAGARGGARRLARNALVEAALGLMILLDVGALGISVPAAHDQISWPLPITWSVAAVVGPVREAAAVAAAALLFVGIALATWAALGRRRGARGVAGGAAIAISGVVLGGVALSEAAVPTIYLNSPLPYSVATVAAGARTFAEQCVACHGARGYGDGPAAAGLLVKPADLARQHVGHHTDGTFFWWISHGKGVNAMPAFADVLDEPQRWEAIGFLHAQFDAETARRLGPRIDPALRVVAPDFAFERGGGGQQTLSMLREAWSVLLVFYTWPSSEPRLKSLAEAAKRLDLGGLRIVAVPLGEGVETGSIFTPGDPDLAAAYGLFRNREESEEAPPPDHLEYLIDAWGYLRARFAGTDAATPEQLVAMLEAVDREPPPPPVGKAAGGHSH